ncbi:hypothetical protein ABN028_19370 [Actinopolymorpha sp. B17G11]|uniref:hypothetical protein n=1 Tax=Actinopolymorpha sp. B17G11 TaxID=3160861 RepID=UPI0032E4D2EA
MTEGLRDSIAEHAMKWAGAVPDDRAGEGNPSGRIVVEVAGQEPFALDLNPSQLFSLLWMFMDGYRKERVQAERDALAKEMTAQIVKVARENRIVGDVIADALHMAAKRLYHPWYLVAGRPGSWEAGIVMEMAADGEDTTDADTVALRDLFVRMGEQRLDGGDFLSLALGEAATEIKSLGTLAQGVWADRIDNIGGQYASDEARAGSTQFGRWN